MLNSNFPKIVCLCGSSRFEEAHKDIEARLSLQGIIVLTIGTTRSLFDKYVDKSKIPEAEDILNNLHKRKIEMADEIFIVNPDGYIGEATRNEIAFAKSLGKPIHYLESIR